MVSIQEFDTLLTDVKGESIRGIEMSGVTHLSEITSGDGVSYDDVLHGVTFGNCLRVFAKALLTAKGKSLNAIMLVNAGSPCTLLTSETFKAPRISLEDQPESQAHLSRLTLRR